MKTTGWLQGLVSVTFALSFALWGITGIGCSGPTTNNSNDASIADTSSGNDTSGGNDTSPGEGTSVVPDGSTQPRPDTPTTNSVTWYKDIQPLIQKSCLGCHSKGGVGPFALTSYEEVKANAGAVKWSIESGQMPPWSPSAQNAEKKDCEELEGARRLSPLEIKTITEWFDKKMPMGDPKDEKPYKPVVDSLDSVDAEVDTQTDYTPPGQSPDDYHCFLTKPVISDGKGKELTGFQFLPGVKSMVHHVLIYSVNKSYSQTLAGRYPEKHWPCTTGALINQGSFGKASLIGVWVPGTDVVRFPQDTGIPMNDGDQLVLEIHYNLSALKGPQPDRSTIRLQFAKQPVKHRMSLSLQLQFQLNIPPKSKDSKATNNQTIPSKVRVWGMMPHMHKFGTKFSVDWTLANGEKKCLIDIPKWDYNWQQTYFFQNPGGLIMNANDKTFMTCTFDNPTDKTIRWGDKTGDEMCLTFYFVSAP